MPDNKLLIIFLGPFPIGNVSTLRIFSYAKELVKSGVDVKIAIPTPLQDAKVNTNRIGIYQGIEYEYVNGIVWKRTNILYKLVLYVIGLLKILKYAQKCNYESILCYDSEIIRNFVLSTYAKFFNKNLIMDITEYPKGLNRGSKFSLFLYKISLFGFKRIITITSQLKNFYSDWLRKDVFILPATVDPSRFEDENNLQSIFQESYIACIFGLHNRDCILDTVKGYIEYFKKSNAEEKLRLLLIGDFDNYCKQHSEGKLISDLIDSNNLKSLIVISGQIENAQIPSILINSEALITTPREYVSGGFPTKLVEYLLSGRPVIASKIGELELYLTDNENVFFNIPGDVISIGERILNLEIKPEEANMVGLNGKKVALSKFNVSSYLPKLINFMFYE